jgi:hypothetical protein
VGYGIGIEAISILKQKIIDEGNHLYQQHQYMNRFYLLLDTAWVYDYQYKYLF